MEIIEWIAIALLHGYTEAQNVDWGRDTPTFESSLDTWQTMERERRLIWLKEAQELIDAATKMGIAG